MGFIVTQTGIKNLFQNFILYTIENEKPEHVPFGNRVAPFTRGNSCDKTKNEK